MEDYWMKFRPLQGAYLWVKNSIASELESKEELMKALYLVGKNPSKERVTKYWLSKTDAISFEEFAKIVDQEPILKVGDLIKAFTFLGGDEYGSISYEKLTYLLTTKRNKMTCQEVEAILNEHTQSKDGNVDYLHLCASIISVANQCQYVAEGNISSIEAQKRVNSRTFTRRPESSRSKSALDKSDSPVSQCLSPYKSDSDDRLEFLSPQESYQDSLCLSSSQNDCQDIPVFLLNHQDCNKVISRGIFFVEDDGRISSHHYTLDLKEDCTVCISTKAVEVERFCEVDVEILLFGEGASGNRSLISSTQFKDKQGVYWLEANLEKGRYWIIPFTTGCWMNSIIDSKDESICLVHTNESRTITLSTAAKEALKKVFENIDLDQDGLVSRNEFTLFSLRTSGEMPTDEEWSIVESNFETRSAKLTVESFLALHEMEFQESGDIGSLNQTLKLMGYNSDLQLDKAAPFSLSVYTVSSIVSLTPCPVMVDSELINKALCRLAVEKGTAIKVKNLNDLSLHQHQLNHRVTIVVQNKSHSTVKVRLDCSNSENCSSHQHSLDCEVDVPPKSTVVGHHLLQLKPSIPWKVDCVPSLILI